MRARAASRLRMFTTLDFLPLRKTTMSPFQHPAHLLDISPLFDPLQNLRLYRQGEGDDFCKYTKRAQIRMCLTSFATLNMEG